MLVKLCLRRILITNACNNFYQQQVATYLTPPLPSHIKRRLDEHRKIQLTNEDLLDHKGELVESPLSVKRERWARFGDKSGVSHAELFPSPKDIEEEKEAELRWWPTIKQMKNNIEKKRQEELKKQREYEEKIAANMAKMPEWIAKYEAEQLSMQEKEQLREKARFTEEDEAREKIGYDVPSKHPVLQQYLRQQKEKHKKEKKKLLKAAKTKTTL